MKTIVVKCKVGRKIFKPSITVITTSGDWAINHPVGCKENGNAELWGNYFVITHIPSGMSFPFYFDKLKHAKEIMREFVADAPAWNGKGKIPEKFIQYGKSILKGLKENEYC